MTLLLDPPEIDGTIYAQEYLSSPFYDDTHPESGGYAGSVAREKLAQQAATFTDAERAIIVPRPLEGTGDSEMLWLLRTSEITLLPRKTLVYGYGGHSYNAEGYLTYSHQTWWWLMPDNGSLIAVNNGAVPSITSYPYADTQTLRYACIVKTGSALVTPASPTYITPIAERPISFTSAGYGAANDGVDFQALLGQQIYMGVYDHATAFVNARQDFSASSMGEPTREGVRRPMLWRWPGEEEGDGKLTLYSKYVLDGRAYDQGGDNNYINSDLRAWLNNGFLADNFTATEVAAMPVTNIRVDGYKYTWGKSETKGFPKTIQDKVYLFAPNWYWAARNTELEEYRFGGSEMELYDFDNYDWPPILRNGENNLVTSYVSPSYEGLQPGFEGGIDNWARGAIVNESGHAMRTEWGGGANGTRTIWGVQPIMKLLPANIIFASEISMSPTTGQTQGDGENYGVGNDPFFGEAFDCAGYTMYGDEDPSVYEYQGNTYTKFRNYKLTLLNPALSLTNLSLSGAALSSGDAITAGQGAALSLTGVVSGADALAYKIVEANGGERRIVGYGTGTTSALSVQLNDLGGGELPAGGDYTLYVWAQKNNALTSFEGSTPRFFKLTIGAAGQETTVASTPTAWAQADVQAAIVAGIVPQALQSGYTAATTRAEFCALAVALYETATGAEIDGRVTFADTDDANVEKMAALGVVTGVGDNLFSPAAKLTREQAATMLARLAGALGKPLPAQTATFADSAGISGWALDAAGQVQAAGIMGGVGENTFAPRGDYTREQSIVTMKRLFDYAR
jgi:hypothetical protein